MDEEDIGVITTSSATDSGSAAGTAFELSPWLNTAESMALSDLPDAPLNLPIVKLATLSPDSNESDADEVDENEGEGESERATGSGVANNSSGNQRSSSPPPNCAICLSRCRNKCFTDSCMHQFCFKCLCEWSKIKPECPLCKQSFKSIIHNVKSMSQYDRYHIQPATQIGDRHMSGPLVYNVQRRTGLVPLFRSPFIMNEEANVSMRPNGRYEPYRHELMALYRSDADAGSISQLWRRYVYDRKLYALPVPDNMTGGFREWSPRFYRENPAQIHRLLPWINRDTICLLRHNLLYSVGEVLEIINDNLPISNILGQTFRRRLTPFFGEHTTHFLHELFNFARSPYDMSGYDRLVQYTHQRQFSDPVQIEFTSSDDDEVQAPNNAEASNDNADNADNADTADTADNEEPTQRRRNTNPLASVIVTNPSNSQTFSVSVSSDGRMLPSTRVSIRGASMQSAAINLSIHSRSNDVIEIDDAELDANAEEAANAEVAAINNNRRPVNPQMVITDHIELNSSPDNADDGSSSSDDCQFVLERKPPHLRTPELVSLNSESDSDVVFVDETIPTTSAQREQQAQTSKRQNASNSNRTTTNVAAVEPTMHGNMFMGASTSTGVCSSGAKNWRKVLSEAQRNQRNARHERNLRSRNASTSQQGRNRNQNQNNNGEDYEGPVTRLGGRRQSVRQRKQKASRKRRNSSSSSSSSTTSSSSSSSSISSISNVSFTSNSSSSNDKEQSVQKELAKIQTKVRNEYKSMKKMLAMEKEKKKQEMRCLRNAALRNRLNAKKRKTYDSDSSMDDVALRSLQTYLKGSQSEKPLPKRKQTQSQKRTATATATATTASPTPTVAPRVTPTSSSTSTPTPTPTSPTVTQLKREHQKREFKQENETNENENDVEIPWVMNVSHSNGNNHNQAASSSTQRPSSSPANRNNKRKYDGSRKREGGRNSKDSKDKISVRMSLSPSFSADVKKSRRASSSSVSSSTTCSSSSRSSTSDNTSTTGSHVTHQGPSPSSSPRRSPKRQQISSRSSSSSSTTASPSPAPTPTPSPVPSAAAAQIQSRSQSQSPRGTPMSPHSRDSSGYKRVVPTPANYINTEEEEQCSDISSDSDTDGYDHDIYPVVDDYEDNNQAELTDPAAAGDAGIAIAQVVTSTTSFDMNSTSSDIVQGVQTENHQESRDGQQDDQSQQLFSPERQAELDVENYDDDDGDNDDDDDDHDEDEDDPFCTCSDASSTNDDALNVQDAVEQEVEVETLVNIDDPDIDVDLNVDVNLTFN